MSSTFLILCIVLTLVSAFVAYLGDLLGRHVGKRRVKLFGLRPRVSAIVVTTITGGLITLLTIAALWGLSENVRYAAEHVDEVRELQAAAQEAMVEAKRQVDIATDQLAGLETQNEQLTKAVQDTELERARLTSELDKLDETVEEQRVLAEMLRADLAQLEKKRLRQDREIDANTAYILDQETTIAQLQQQTKTLTARVDTYRESDIVVYEGTFLAGDYFLRTEEPAELMTKLSLLYKQATVPPGVTPQWPREADYGAAAKLIRQHREPMVAVVLKATENVTEGGEMPVQIAVVENTLIFKTNDVIYLHRVSAKLEGTAVDAAVAEILETVSRQAMAAGVVPLGGNDQITQMPAQSVTRLLNDIQAQEPPYYIGFQATKPVFALDQLIADANFTWKIVPLAASS